MFGVIVSGKLVQTDAQQVSENKFIFNIQDADNINHIVVFLTGQVPFPDGLGGAVYFCWPNPTSGSSWKFLGHISNSKPSAIFKITQLKSGRGGDVPVCTSHLFGQVDQSDQSHVAQIGISAEPLDQLLQQTPEIANTVTVDTFVEFSSKMHENLFNYSSSFAVSQSQMMPNPTETYVPMSTLRNWFQNFQRRLQQNPYFWRS
ncbi:hypothetical protein CHS0354_009202 [Potamilus streckersoni]|uniref:Hikeshi-like domain-containing protein n=1 Tax=Potamilus streckersoni TaxID=2493646 RepID=A0AAE0T015_9BIVA|nr:hypothetical protein CHS0354_009202 [Potamilus streckersoni]